MVVLAHDPNCPRWQGDLAPDPTLAFIHRLYCARCAEWARAAAAAQRWGI